jgi:hypothetical protein
MSRDPKEPPLRLMATIGVAENAASVGRSTMGSQAYERAEASVYTRSDLVELEFIEQACF